MNKLRLFVLVTILLSNCGLSAVISTMEQLDDAALFSFSIISDNKGYGDNYANTTESPELSSMRMISWIASNDVFCLGSGDHIFPDRDRFDFVMRTNSYFNKNFYPIIADHDNETKLYDYGGVKGSQSAWGRGWVIYKALSNAASSFFTRSNATEVIQFRQPNTATKINNNGVMADDQLVDYYLKRKQGAFTFHVIGIHIGDSSVLAQRTITWMMNIFDTLSVTKTDYDIVILLTHCDGNFFSNVKQAKFIEDGFSGLSNDDIDKIMSTADLVTDASNHIYGRHKDYDGRYDGTQALWVNTGCVTGTGDTEGYVTFHMFDKPPRFTMQFVDAQRQSSRKLLVGPKPRHSSQVTDDQTVPMLKYVNGPLAPVNWSEFDMTNSAQLISMSVTNVMNPGQTYPVTITMKNRGAESWQTSAGHALGSYGNTNWGMSRVALPGTVATNGQVTFTFNVTAPTNRGMYAFQWRMTDDVAPNAGWFGEVASNANIMVGAQVQRIEAEKYATNVGFAAMPTTDVGGGTNMGDSAYGEYMTYPVTITHAGTFNILTRVASVSSPIQFDLKNGTNVICSINRSATGGDQTWVTTTNAVVLNKGSMTLTLLAKSSFNINWIELRPIDNSAPVITSSPVRSIDAGSLYTYTITTSDIEGDARTLSAPVLPSWLTLDSSLGVLSGTPSVTNIGVHSVSLRVADASGSSIQAFDVMVSSAGNEAPVFTSVPVTGVMVSNLYSYTVSATDGDWDEITCSVITKPSWLSLNTENWVLSGIPSASNAGVHAVSLAVMDGHFTVTQQFNLVVFPIPPNNLVLNPSFELGTTNVSWWTTGGTATNVSDTAQHGSRSLRIQAPVGGTTPTRQSIAVTAGTVYSYSVWIHASGITTSAVVFDTGIAGSGKVVVSNNAGWTKYSGSVTSATTSLSLRLSPQATNFGGVAYMDNLVLIAGTFSSNPPVITSIPETNAAPQNLYSYRLLATDAENEPQTFTGVTIPAWLSFNTNSGVLSGTPTGADAGTHPVALSVRNGSLSVTQNFTIAVMSLPPANRYAEWAAAEGVGEPNEDDDNDGRSNFYEYTLFGSPTNAIDLGGEPTVVTVANDLEYKHWMRNDDSNLIYAVQMTTNLLFGEWTNSGIPAEIVGTNGQYYQMKYRIPMQDPGSYIRLKVTD